MQRGWIYQRERFPLLLNGSLVAIFAAGMRGMALPDRAISNGTTTGIKPHSGFNGESNGDAVAQQRLGKS